MSFCSLLGGSLLVVFLKRVQLLDVYLAVGKNRYGEPPGYSMKILDLNSFLK